MTLKSFMTITSVVAFIFGLAFIIAPTVSLDFYGVTVNVTGEFLGRYFGASLIGTAFLAWLTRNAPASPTRRAVLASLFVTMLLGFLVAVYDTFAGAGNALVWLNVGIYLILAIGFLYYSFKKED
jgi:ABC-type transport system involved in multi-copper enzyme maturation permease subunit